MSGFYNYKDNVFVFKYEKYLKENIDNDFKRILDLIPNNILDACIYDSLSNIHNAIKTSMDFSYPKFSSKIIKIIDNTLFLHLNVHIVCNNDGIVLRYILSATPFTTANIFCNIIFYKIETLEYIDISELLINALKIVHLTGSTYFLVLYGLFHLQKENEININGIIFTKKKIGYDKSIIVKIKNKNIINLIEFKKRR